jgi:hypothetical protein
MGSLLGVFASSVVLVPILVLAALITFAAVRGSRNKYVPNATLVLERFSIYPAAPGEPVIHISGRQKGILSWILTNLGMESRVELTVTEKEWTLREGSLAGMLVTNVSLKGIRATICGYQRSVLAFFFAVVFAIYAVWSLLGIIPILVTAFRVNTEWGWESAAASTSTVLFITLAWLAACGIAGLVFYLSKRVAFGVNAGHVYGIVFKRSFIENAVIDLETAEQATALLNCLVAAAVYGIPLAEIPPPSTPKSHAAGRKAVPMWALASVYAGLAVFGFILSWYGKGVELKVTTDPAGSYVFLDHQFVGQAGPGGGPLLLKHTTRENHLLQVQLAGFEQFTQVVAVGGLESSQDVSVKLTVLNYPVTVFTTPGNSHVLVDGKEAGVSNEAGSLEIPKVDRGTHQFTVSHDGFRTVTESVGVFGRHAFHIGLVGEAEAARQEAEARQREIASHLERGRMFFRQGQYNEASAECDSVLKIDPSNAAALALKKQIDQTRKILGQ